MYKDIGLAQPQGLAPPPTTSPASAPDWPFKAKQHRCYEHPDLHRLKRSASIAVADPGVPTSKVGAPTYYFGKFFLKTA